MASPRGANAGSATSARRSRSSTAIGRLDAASANPTASSALIHAARRSAARDNSVRIGFGGVDSARGVEVLERELTFAIGVVVGARTGVFDEPLHPVQEIARVFSRRWRRLA